jgi:hypothetical protein
MQLVGLLFGGGVAVAGLLFCYLFAKAALFIAILSAAALVLFGSCLTPAARQEMGHAPVLAAVGLPVAAWLLPNVWLLYGVAALVVPLLARRGGQVPALYLFALLLLPGLDQFVAVGSLRLFGFGVHDALACGAAAILVGRPRWRAAVPTVLDLPFWAMFGLLVAATSRDTSPTNAFRVFVDMGLDCALPYWIVSRGVRDRADLRLCMLHLAAAAAVLSLVLAYEAVKSWPLYNVLFDRYALPERPVVKSRGGMLRAGGPFNESTSVAMVMVFCFLAASASRSAFRSTRHHLLLLLALLLGLVMPQSRGAWVGLLTGVAMMDLYRGRIGRLALRFGAVGLVGLGLLAVAQVNSRVSEAVGLSGGSVETVDYREQLFDRGMEELRDSPIIGFPYPELLRRLDDMRQGEGIVDFVNAHLFVVLVSGIVGLVVFNGAFLVQMGRVWRARRGSLGPEDLDLGSAAFVFAALATPVQMLFFTSMGGRVQVMVFVFFALATAVARERRPAGAREDQTPSAAPSFAFASHPSAIPVAPAPSSSSSSSGLSNPIRWSANQP